MGRVSKNLLHYKSQPTEKKAFPGELLLMYRLRASLTQLELAKKLELKSARMLQLWEQGYSLPSAPKLKQLLETYLKLGVLALGQEQEEAHQLWTTVKDFFDTRVQTGKTYPLFDWRWFESLLDKQNSVRLTPTQLQLPVTSVKEVSHNLPTHSMLSCPTLIGRQSELATLQDLIEHKHQGSSLLLISGEAGIGKSRLVAEVKTSAARQGFLLLEGQCFQRDSAIPYAPLLDLFRSYLTRYSSSSLPREMHSFVSTLARLLPDLALLFPSVVTSNQMGFPSTSPQEERFRLFAIMTHFLTEQATQQHPVLLVMEDLHWADDLSLDFILHLAHRSRNIPLHLLVTCRTDAAHPGVRQWLTQLDQARLGLEFALRPLSRVEIEHMVNAILGPEHSIEAELLETLSTLSEGNPFFVEELLKGLVKSGKLEIVEGRKVYSSDKNETGGTFIPRSVQLAVEQRIELLSVEARQTLILAAVAGRRFDFTLLQQSLHYDETYLLLLIKELMAAQLVVEDSAEQFAFRHTLIREVIYSKLLLRERQALHRTLAQTLLQLSTAPSPGKQYLGDLAMHCYEAGMWEQVVFYEYQLGEHALSLYAQQAAVEHLTRAIKAARHLPSPPSGKLYYTRGQAYSTLGEFDHAQSDYERAADLTHRAGEGTMEWQCMISLSLLWAGRDYTRAGSYLRQALELAERMADQILKAHSLNRLGNWMGNTGRIVEGLQAHQEALKLFEAEENLQGMAETFDLLGTVYGMGGDRVKAVEQLGQAISLFRSQSNLASLISSLAMRAIQSMPGSNETTFCSLRTRDECVLDATEALQLACQIGSLPGQAFAGNALGNTLLSFGEFGPALSHIQQAQRIATEIEHQQWMIATSHGLGQIYLQLFAPAEALVAIQSGVSLAYKLGSTFWITTLTALQGRAYLLKQDLEMAQSTLQTIMPPQQPPRNLPERQISLVWGEIVLAQGKPDLALQIAEHLLESTRGEMAGQFIPHLLKLKGNALLALARPGEAASNLEKAKQGAQERNARTILWTIHYELGQIYRRLRRYQQAGQESTAARQVIQELAATIPDDALRHQFEQAALTSLLEKKPTKPTRQAFGALTAREHEVAILIAQGRTSREISELLIVSERTAEVHVSNILGKLGFTSRTQIAAWVVESGFAKR